MEMLRNLNNKNGEKHMSNDVNEKKQVLRVKVSEISANPDNFRKKFDEDSIKELAASIKANGLEQMPVVRGTGDVKKPFVLVMGERRLRAVRLLEWEMIDVVLAPASKTEQDLDIAGFVENIQRADLTTFEQAAGCVRLIEKHKMSVTEIGKKTGRSVTYVNRLVKPFTELAPKIRDEWQDGAKLCTIETLGKLVSKYEGGAQMQAWENLKEFGTFERPEDAGEDGGQDGDGDGKTNGDNKEASSGFRLNARQVMERYDVVRKSLQNGKQEPFAFSLLQYVIGKRKMPPEGITLPETATKKGPSKPVKTRAARSTASA